MTHYKTFSQQDKFICHIFKYSKFPKITFMRLKISARILLILCTDEANRCNAAVGVTFNCVYLKSVRFLTILTYTRIYTLAINYYLLKKLKYL